uniref:Alternative protein MLXIP n=1 Tax=Homo sapiens TaxID=9606 RepID=L8EAR3_HUMAN|nr:alternative protein MLXIP [Homo sapiens]
MWPHEMPGDPSLPMESRLRPPALPDAQPRGLSPTLPAHRGIGRPCSGLKQVWGLLTAIARLWEPLAVNSLTQ